MMLMPKLILMLSMTLSISSQCTEGCLSCNGDDKCLLCDFQQGYYFRDYGCIQSNIDNCSLLNLNGLCLYCEPPTYLDEPNNKCVEVDSEIAVQNCLLYSNDQNCLSCSGNYYPLSGICTDVADANLIQNCAAYSGLQQCYACNDGYILNYQGTACYAENSSQQNCQIYSTIQCSSCQDGYSFLYDFGRVKLQLAIQDAQQDSNNDQNLLKEQTYLQYAVNPILEQSFKIQQSCIEYMVDNCQTFNSFSECKECVDGYYLSNNTCYAYPDEAIAHCKVYNSSTSCNECQVGYYLANQTTCSRITEIDNCILYDGTASTTRCVLCERSYYIRNNQNSCTLRTNFINLCQDYSPTADKCLSCQTTDQTYVITDDGLKCLPDFGNCLTYATSSVNTTTLSCTQCKNGYFLNTTEKYCQIGSVTNCLVYDTDNDVCTSCVNGYYLGVDEDGGQACVPSTEVNGCDTYDSTNQDLCSSCQDLEYYMFTRKNRCYSVGITGCQTFSSRTTCSSCKDGYDYISNQECRPLEENTFCVRAINGVCQLCEDQYFLYQGSCFPAFKYKQAQCARTEFTSSGNYYFDGECSICKSYAIPYNQVNQFVCLANSELENMYLTSFYVPYCASYKLNSAQDGVECYKCNHGYFLTTSGGSNQCVTSCDSNEKEINESLILVNGVLVYNNQKTCVDVADGYVTYSNVYGQEPNFSGSYYPLQYTDTYVHKNNFSAITDYLLNSSNNLDDAQYTYDGLYKFAKNTSKYTITDISEYIIDNCDMYSEIQVTANGAFVGCTKCSMYNFGIIKNWEIEYCHDYNDTVTGCDVCIHTYYPTNSGLICSKIPTINGCMRYSKTAALCEQCYAGYYLSSDFTTCLENTRNCLDFNKFTNECVSCKTGYLLSDDKTVCLEAIEHCVEYYLGSNPAICVFCDYNYAVNAGVCVKLTDECWFKEAGLDSNACLLKQNTLVIESLNQCVLFDHHPHCQVYESEEVCKVCEDGYYKYRDGCCELGYYGNGGNSVCNLQLPNCLTYSYVSGAVSCSECDNGYHFSNGNNCCLATQYYDSASSTCVTNLYYDSTSDYNDPHCLVYRIDEQTCDTCIANYYSSNNHCCPQGSYYKAASSACVSIQTDQSINNCKEYNTTTSQCTLCEYEGSPSTNTCCDSDEFFDTACYTKPTSVSCLTFNSSLECTSCAANYYLEDDAVPQNDCCSVGTHYYNTTSDTCVAVTGAQTISNCAKYDSSIDCIECNATYYLSGDQCCLEGYYYNGVTCEEITNQFTHCKNLTVELNDTTMFAAYNDIVCAECETGYYINTSGICTTIYDNTDVKTVGRQNGSDTDIDNCISLDFSANDTNNIPCGECLEGYYVQNNGYTCCIEGTFYNSLNDDCIAIDGSTSRIEHCLIFDTVNNQCLQVAATPTTAQLAFTSLLHTYGTCAATRYNKYALDTTNNVCTTNASSSSMPTGCLVKGSALCLECQRGYYKGMTCEAKPNCVSITSNGNCDVCKENYQHGTSPVNCGDAYDQSITVDNNLYKCQAIENTVCSKCFMGYNVYQDAATTTASTWTRCCPNGYYWNGNLATCSKIPNKYCSSVDTLNGINSTTGQYDCKTCFIDSDLCNQTDNFLLDIERLSYNLGVNRPQLLLSSDFLRVQNRILYENYTTIYLGTDTKQCCPHGQAYDSSLGYCTSFGIDNCLEASYNSGLEIYQCSRCKLGYNLNSSLTCTLMDSSNCVNQQYNYLGVMTTSYLSNGNCCIQGTYWDQEKMECLSIPDPFCNRANSATKCTTCKTGFQVVSSQYGLKFNYVLKNYNYVDRCPSIEHNFVYEPCFPTFYGLATTDALALTSSVTTYSLIGKQMQNCLQFDMANRQCLKCQSGYYLADSDSKYCCPEGNVFMNGRCFDVSFQQTLLSQCENFTQENLCEQCKSGYTMQLGFCCETGYFLDTGSYTCTKWYPNCTDYSYELEKCVSCTLGHYQIEGHCCRFGTQWDEVTGSCVSFDYDLMVGCKKAASKDVCAECVSDTLLYTDYTEYYDASGSILTAPRDDLQTSYYLYQGGCYPYSSFLATLFNDSTSYYGPTIMSAQNNFRLLTQTSTQLTSAEYFFLCEQIDDFGNCVSCTDGKYLYDTKTYNNGVSASYRFLCCDPGYYPKGSTVMECAQDLSNIDCVHYYYDTITSAYKCDTCSTGYYLSDDHCCVNGHAYNSTSERCEPLFSILRQNCAKFNGPVCTKCDSGYYLSSGACCEDNFYYNGANTQCEPISTSTVYDDLNTCTQINNISGLRCTKCYDNSDINDIKTVVFYDGTDYTCSSDTSHHCSLYNTASSQCISDCDTNYYSNSSLCCASDQKVDSGACVTIVPANLTTNCVIYDSSEVCTKCDKDYYLKTDDTCAQITGSSCIDGSCDFCPYGYYIDGGSCTSTQGYVINYEQGSYDDTFDLLKCKETSPAYYESGSSNMCCPEGFYYNNDYLDCLQNTFNSDLHFCLQYDNNVCTQCDFINNFYMAYETDTEFKCCQFGYFYDPTAKYCKIIAGNESSPSQLNCRFFYYDDDNTLQCREPTTAELALAIQTACSSGYLTNERCCAESYYYSVDGNNCQTITTISTNSAYTQCLRVDSDNKCTKCSGNYYVSFGFCCNEGEYYNQSTNQCVTYYDTNCLSTSYDESLSSLVCTTCDTGYSVDVYHPQCCKSDTSDIPRYFVNSTCGDYLQIDATQSEYCLHADSASNCVECQSGYYMSNNGTSDGCCEDGDFNDPTAGCTALTLTDCIRGDYDATDSVELCTKCVTSTNALYTAVNGVCCNDSTDFYSSSLEICVDQDTVLGNCSQTLNGTCTACKDGYHLSNSICCEDGYFAEDNSGKRKCSGEDTISHCLQQSTATVCLTCATGYQVANGNCCLDNQHFNTDASINACYFSEEVSNCIIGGMETVSLVDKYYCTQCKEGYNLFQTQTWQRFCCPEGQQGYANADDETYCIDNSTLYSNCTQFDDTQKLCTECNTGYYLSEKLCCAEGTYFVNGSCVNIEVSNCATSTDGTCATCKTDFYKTNGGCCPGGKLWDSALKQCVEGDSVYCEKYVDGSTTQCSECVTVLDGGSAVEIAQLTGNQCCPFGQYGTTDGCASLIDHCVLYSSQTQCSQCATGFTLSSNSELCCSEYTYFDSTSNTCLETLPLSQLSSYYSHCIDWSGQTLECTGCIEGYYIAQVSPGICCPEGFIYTGGNCSTPVTVTDCLQEISTTCNKCASGYVLNANTCVEIFANCLTFDPTGVCTKCDDSTYLTDDHCCPPRTFWNGTICDALSSVDYCLLYSDATTCSVCDEGYYLTGAVCTLKTQYNNAGVSTDGNVRSCEQYGADGDTCIKCVQGYTLMNIPVNYPVDLNTFTTTITAPTGTATKTICFRNNLTHCDTSQYAVASSQNQLQCNTCQSGYKLDPSQTATLQYNYHLPPNCVYTINTSLFDSSSFQCHLCEADYYLDSSYDCQARTYSVTGVCRENLRDQDGCKSCNYGKYLVGIQCEDYEADCDYQTTTGDCLVCDPDTQYTYWNDSLGDYECIAISTFANENVIDDPQDFPAGYIKSCTKHHQCKNEFLNNLSLTYQNYFSCHVCNDSDRIPFISLSINSSGSVNSLKRYSMFTNSGSSLRTYRENEESKQSECFLSDLSEFDLPNGQTGSDFPANCALGVFNADLPINILQSKFTTGTFNYANASAICVECKPGYKATRYSFMNMVTACTLINFCESGTDGKQFGACDKCQDGYYYPYSSTAGLGGLDNTQCIRSSTNHDENCYVFNTSTKKCSACKNGYSLNHDGKCEILTSAYCSGTNNFLQTYTASEYLLAYYRGEQGCSECQEGFTRFFNTSDDYVCIGSSYSINPTASSTVYIANCEHYSNEYVSGDSDPLKCYSCADGYILTTSNTCITKTQSLANCATAVNASQCSVCSTNYYLVNNQCTQGNIDNCQEYQNGTTTLKCSSCDDYFYLTSSGTCARGTVSHCKEYNGQSSCNTCDDNYYLIQVQNNVDYCMPLHSLDQNCEVGGFSSSAFNNFELDCQTCKDGYYLDSITDRNVCLSINLVKNCTAYHKNSTFSSSTLQCTQCSDDHYLNNNKCLKRQNYIDNCAEYQTSADLCQSCEDGYYVSTDGESCVGNPIGITGCEVYSDSENCVKCNSSYYLNNSTCSLLSSGNSVPNCDDYNSSQTCIGCQDGYTLEDGECNINAVDNCVTFDTSTSCAVCEDGYGLEVQDNQNVCVVLPAIDGCVSQSQIDPYACLQCDEGKYLSDDSCIEIDSENTVENCIAYDSTQQCQICASNYYLGVDKNSCTQVTEDTNCYQLEETSQGFCTFCKVGYKLNENGVCEESPESQLSNCFLTQYEDESLCAICQSGYHMNDSYECVGEVTEEPTNPDNNGSSTTILSLFVMLAYIFAQ